MMNALSRAERVSGGSEIGIALQRWEAQERPLTDHTQARAAELVRTRALGSGMQWDVALALLREVPCEVTIVPRKRARSPSRRNGKVTNWAPP